MFKTLEIRNFQSHKETNIDFLPGVNIVTGSSNSGKTSILRALNWAINNRPRGTSIIRKGQNKSEVVLFIGEKTKEIGISRFRDNIDNCYNLATPDASAKFEAIGSDVPKEINDVLNFSDINIQEQLSPYFLVLDTPGEIAKYLNSITHLDEVDKIVSLLSSKLRMIEGDVKNLEGKLSKLKMELDEVAKLNLEEFEKNLEKATAILKQIEDTKLDVMLIDDIIIRIEATDRNLAKIPANLEQLDVDVSEILESYSEISKNYDSLDSIVHELEILDKKLVELPYDVNELKQGVVVVLEEYQSKSKDMKALLLLQEEIPGVTKDIEEITDDIDNCLAEEKRILAELDVCILCETVLTDVSKKKMLENFK